jgi:redox-sensitive bicupin YhaK (pirin superfamily)
MSTPVIQTVPLGFQWPTIDPFLFCVHHLDRYPAANHHLGPAASLEGRPLGQDFEGIDGWRMYHGQVVPGFPAHPHRGFETVTYVRRGLIDHADSAGASARYGRGDVQWMTAGSGLVHSEMFPLLDRDGPNTVELFQIWINLAAEDKMAEPYFAMLWDEDISRVVQFADGPGSPAVEITVIAGRLGDAASAAPPPRSWAARADSDVAIWHVQMDAGSQWTMPAARHPDTVRTVYVFDGGELRVDEESVAVSTGAVLTAEQSVQLSADQRVEALVLQGRPIAEPVARYGPFVMNTEAQIRQAVEDYQRTQFGGWQWGPQDPTHGLDGARFVKRADGRIEQPTAG